MKDQSGTSTDALRDPSAAAYNNSDVVQHSLPTGIELQPLERVESALPTFAQSEFDTIIRRQRHSRGNHLKLPHAHRLRSPRLDADWQFAGWGSVSYVDISSEELRTAGEHISTPRKIQLSQLRATSISGNGVFGSVFYAFPAVAASSSIFSPLALTIACLSLFFFRPILLELSSAARMNGANYTYLLQFSGKAMGILGAAATLLDALSTSAVSAATASAYLKGEFSHLPIGEASLAVCILMVLTLIALANMRESSGIALSFTILHLLTMAILMISAIVAWARSGSFVLAGNWAIRPTGSARIARDIFNGVCIGFLGTTGFECTPAFIEDIKPSAYKPVLRNLLYGALALNGPLLFLVYSVLPEAEILGGVNLLSLLAEKSGGKWLRILVVVDATLVLAGGVLTGFFTVCGLLDRLTRDHLLPNVFLRKLPFTESPFISIVSAFVLSVAVNASSGFSLSTASAVFSISFLTVMGLYSISFMCLRLSRNRLPRSHRTSLWIVAITLLLIAVVLIGNVLIHPKVLGIFVGYLSAVMFCLSARTYQVELLKLAITVYDQAQILHRFSWDRPILKRIRSLQRQPVYVWVKSDDIHSLLQATLYVEKNEATSRMVFIHAYEALEQMPSELEANSKLLDEAFPSCTIDLIFLKGTFSPALTQAVSAKLDAPLSSCFMFSPGIHHGHDLAAYGGLRVIG